MKHFTTFVVGLLGLLGSLATSLCAEENRQLLPEIVVTATRTEQADLDLPYTTERVDGERLQLQKMVRSMPEALRETPAVLVQKTGHAQGSPFIRGFTGFRTLYLVDGIRVNNSVFRDGPNQYLGTIDPFSLGKLELTKGPGSVLYGSDAIGGTINAFTADPWTGLAGEKKWSGRGYYRFATAEDAHTVRSEGRTRLSEDVALQAGVTVKRFGDLRSGDGTLPKTGYDEIDVDLKGQAYLSDFTTLTLAHQQVSIDDAWRVHRTPFARSFHGSTIGNEQLRSLDQDRRLTYAQLEGELPSGLADAYTFTLSYHQQEEERFRIKQDDSGERQGFDVGTVGASLQLDKAVGRHQWVYGAEFYHDAVDSFKRKFGSDGALREPSIQGPIADNADYSTLGVYVQDTVAVNERWDVILGGRYNYIDVDAGRFENPITGEADQFSDDFDALVGSARVVYRLFPEQGIHLFGGVSQGFRAPNLSDLTRLDSARSNEIETPSTDLDPEEFVAYEVGVKSASDHHTAELAYFYTMIDDLIVRTPTGVEIDDEVEVTKRNAGEGFVQGVELSGRVALSDALSLWGNATWFDGEVDGFPTSDPTPVTEPIDRLMPLTGHVGLYFSPVDRWWMEGVVSAADKADELSLRDQADTQRIPPGGTPGYAIGTVRGGVRFSDGLSLSLALENIADKNYRVHGSGLNEPGRNLVVAVNYTF